jgi:hypothetical protein
MSNAADQPPHHFHLLCLAQSLFGTPALGNVFGHADRELRPCIHSAHQRDGKPDPAHGRRLAFVLGFQFVGFPLAVHQFAEPPGAGVSFRVRHLPEILASKFLARVSQHAFDCRVALQNKTVEVALQDSHVGGFEDDAKALVSIAHHPSAFAHRHIADGDQLQFALTEPERYASGLNLQRCTVAPFGNELTQMRLRDRVAPCTLCKFTGMP